MYMHRWKFMCRESTWTSNSFASVPSIAIGGGKTHFHRPNLWDNVIRSLEPVGWCAGHIRPIPQVTGRSPHDRCNLNPALKCSQLVNGSITATTKASVSSIHWQCQDIVEFYMLLVHDRLAFKFSEFCWLETVCNSQCLVSRIWVYDNVFIKHKSCAYPIKGNVAAPACQALQHGPKEVIADLSRLADITVFRY